MVVSSVYFIRLADTINERQIDGCKIKTVLMREPYYSRDTCVCVCVCVCEATTVTCGNIAEALSA